MKKAYLLFIFLMSVFLTSFTQVWMVYDCSVLPNESVFGFVTSNVAGDPATNVILDDPDNPGNRLLELISPGPDPGKFMWRYNLPNDKNDPITFVIRLKSSSVIYDRTMELDFEQGGYRERLFLKNDNTWELKQMAKTGNLPGSSLDWHIIRISKNGNVVNFYFDENPVALGGGVTATTDANNYFRIGDGNGSSTLGGLIDWMAWDTTGAYAPGEGVALPDSLVQEVPSWIVYDADSIPDKSNIAFSTSNVAGDPATNTILADPDNVGNNLLELISPGADPAKFMWRHNFPNSVNDPLTMVARMKGSPGGYDRTMEFDILQAGFRERLYVKNDNSWELKESGIKGPLPIGVMGWHIYRITKIGDSVDIYLDENPTPFVSGKAKTGSVDNYYRFGDGNGGSTVGGIVDWIIWDTTGAYAPGRGIFIPDSLVSSVESSVASLSDLTASTGTLVPDFHSDTLEYHLNLEPLTTAVTLTATPADGKATVSGAGDFTVFPDTVEIMVTAEDGLKIIYTVYISAVPESPLWIVYDADSVPDKSNIAFETSNVAGDPATNEIIEDPDNAGNYLLKLVSPGADPGKFMWKHSFTNSVDDPLTMVARVKGVSDTLDRTMEFDIQQAGFRERLYLKTDNTWELKESAIKGNLPIGVMGWHIFRITKAGDVVNFYIDENPVPFVSGNAQTSSTENYFRFGDGNGSSTLGGFIDWIIWDTTGTYAPGSGLLIPDSLVVTLTSSDATLSALTSSTGKLVPDFHPDSIVYHLNLVPETEIVTLAGTPADVKATVSGDGDFTVFPDTVKITVKAEDGLKINYTVYISAVPATPHWVVYDADSVPDKSNIDFVTSNVAGDPATNEILEDPENPGNYLLKLVSPGADPGKFMWKHELQNSIDDPLTMIARVKGVSDTLDRTMEFDLQQAGFRERLYLKNDNTWELKESATKGDLPIGVMGWHIYRMTKIGDSVDLYLDENPVPFVSVKAKSTSTENYFRFGDGNGSSTLGGYIDWVIWDTVGAYAPGLLGPPLPDSLIMAISSSDATLSALTASRGKLVPNFHPDSLVYHLNLVPETEIVTLAGTPADVKATVSGDGDFTVFPNTVEITVKAEDGLKINYTVYISAVPATPHWVVYDADSVPDKSDITFVTSNVAGDPATNEILEDPDNNGNYLLKLVSPGADPGKFMWKHEFSNSVDDPLTVVARVKGVSDTLDRTMELDLQQAGFRERLYLKNDNTWELKESAKKGDLPIGVMGWHIYRMTKIGDSVDVYLDENPVPFVSVKTKSSTTENYFRFGDGNGSSTLGGYVDWIIWDTIGAYAPGLLGPPIPDSLVMAISSSDARLSDLTTSVGSLAPAFHVDTLGYNLELPTGTETVTLTATASNLLASVEGDGEYTTFPATAEIKVKAEDGLIRVYTVNISVIAGIQNTTQRLFRIYPNPASDYLNLELTDANLSVYVYNVLGKLVLQKSNAGNRVMLDVSGLSKGVYYVKVVTGQGTVAEQIIIE